MATLSTHTLSGLDGTHAGSIPVTLYSLEEDGARKVLFESMTDPGGRLVEEVELASGEGRYELVFRSGAYFAALQEGRSRPQILDEVVIRFAMPDPGARYHIPVILSPNSYSVWWSS